MTVVFEAVVLGLCGVFLMSVVVAAAIDLGRKDR